VRLSCGLSETDLAGGEAAGCMNSRHRHSKAASRKPQTVYLKQELRLSRTSKNFSLKRMIWIKSTMCETMSTRTSKKLVKRRTLMMSWEHIDKVNNIEELLSSGEEES
jgi:hypothetical protein